jgi:hypothetical protein
MCLLSPDPARSTGCRPGVKPEKTKPAKESPFEDFQKLPSQAVFESPQFNLFPPDRWEQTRLNPRCPAGIPFPQN